MCNNRKHQDQIESRTERTNLPSQAGDHLGEGSSVCLQQGEGRKIRPPDLTRNPKDVFSSETSVSSEESEKDFSSLSERKFRILVVDDNENIRDMLEDFLNFEGHKPVLARDGEEALKIFSEQDFDFVITDLGMPGMSGWELTNHIKQRKPEIPVAIITGWGAQLGVEDLKEHKVEWILSKPFRLDQVKQLVERFAGRLSEQRKVSRPSE